MTAHSRIGASSMKRWAACPGSVKISEGIASRSSSFAAEGTMAHAVAQAWLDDEPPVAGGEFVWDDDGIACTAIVEQEMLDHVAVYVDAVRERWDGGEASLLVEQHFHLADLHEDLFGTSDAVVWQAAARRLSVIDLKYGAGVAVEVQANPQLRYYALGALFANPQWKPKEIEVVIVQPRCPHEDGPVRVEVIQVAELVDFAGELVEAVKRVEAARSKWHEYDGGKRQWSVLHLHEGDHCRFCPAAAVCPKLESRAQETARNVFSKAAPYDQAKLAETLEWLPVLEAWIKNVREFAYAEAEQGHAIPRHKLVEKRATRKWRDEANAAAGLANFLDEAELYERKIISPAAAEKLLPKEDREVLDGLCVKESSGHTLVHESDKRPAVKLDAKSAFQGN